MPSDRTDAEATAPRHLEDFSVGQRFGTAEHSLDAAEIKAFAARYDPQPFHLDEAAAEQSFFRGLAASGWHVAAVTMRLLVDAAPIAGGMIGAGGDIAWPQATRPGDRLTVESEVIDVRPSASRPDRGIVTLRCETRNQRGEVVQVLTARMLVFRRG